MALSEKGITMSYVPQRNRMPLGTAKNAALAAAIITAGATVCLGQDQSGGPEFPPLDPIMDSVAKLRGLDFKRPVPAETQDQEGWGAYLAVEIEKAYPAEIVDGMVRGLVKLGMLDEPLDFGEQLHNALLSQAGAYYDTETGNFYYLMTDMPTEELAVLASHELTHALQDQHFDLDKLMSALEQEPGKLRNDDAALAFSSLVEGEATYLMTLWQADRMGRDLTANRRRETLAFEMMSEMSIDMMVTMAQAAGTVYGEDSQIGQAMAAMNDIPMYILEPLYASYMKGAFFVMRLHQEGGWDAVSDAYANLPRSTEQILHPDKYIGGEDGSLRDDPTEIQFPVFDTLDELGYKQLDESVHGELYLAMMLRNFDVNMYEADIAVEGWDGDLYRAIELPSGDVAIVLATTWDTERDADEFFLAYKNALAAKYVGAQLQDREDGDMTAADASSEDGFRGTLVKQGREVFAVEGLTKDLTSDVIGELRSMKIDHVR